MAKRSAMQSTGEDDASRDSSRSLIERAYTLMRADIIEGRLPPGAKLRVEHLRSRYGVSAGTLREAITRLVSDALVAAEPQRGFKVTPVSIDDLEDITRIRLHIELDALRRSIRQAGQAWRDQLQRAYDDLSRLEQPLRPESRGLWEVHNARFHTALISGCASPWTLNVHRLLSRHGERYRRYAISLAGSGRDVHAEHREIFEQAMAGNEARAALALEAHVRNTLDLLLAADRRGEDVFRSSPAPE